MHNYEEIPELETDGDVVQILLYSGTKTQSAPVDVFLLQFVRLRPEWRLRVLDSIPRLGAKQYIKTRLSILGISTVRVEAEAETVVYLESQRSHHALGSRQHSPAMGWRNKPSTVAGSMGSFFFVSPPEGTSAAGRYRERSPMIGFCDISAKL